MYFSLDLSCIGLSWLPWKLRPWELFFSYKSHCLFPLHISTFMLAFCSAVAFSSLFFLLRKIFILRYFFLFFLVIFLILLSIYLTAFLILTSCSHSWIYIYIFFFFTYSYLSLFFYFFFSLFVLPSFPTLNFLSLFLYFSSFLFSLFSFLHSLFFHQVKLLSSLCYIPQLTFFSSSVFQTKL